MAKPDHGSISKGDGREEGLGAPVKAGCNVSSTLRPTEHDHDPAAAPVAASELPSRAVPSLAS